MLQILLAEDNLGDVIIVQEALQEHEIECDLHVVRDGSEAIEFVNRIGQAHGTPCPNLLLLDMNLPKVDGPQILSLLRNHPPCRYIPVIVVSSSDSEKDRAKMAELGISYYFRKPLDYSAFLELGAIVRRILALDEGVQLATP